MTNESKKAGEFQAEAKARRTGLLREFWDFLKHNKKWWIAPILIALLAIGVLVVLSGTSLSWMVYTVF